MKWSWLVGLALATALAAAPAAKADTTFYYGLSGAAVTNPADPNCCAPSISGSVILSGTAIAGEPGSYDITGGSGITFSFNGGPSYSAIVIGDSSSPTPIYNPPGSNAQNYNFQYDDVLTPGASPVVDYYGLLFEITGAGAYDGAVIEIFSANATNPQVSGTTYWWAEYLIGSPNYGFPIGANNGGYGDPLDDFFVSEPSSLLLLGTGLLGLTTFLYRRRQTGQHWTA